MASVGYGYGGYGKSFYGQPVFEFGEATLAEASGFTATATNTFSASGTSGSQGSEARPRNVAMMYIIKV